ncbi:putative serine/threonine protein kinase [Trypanosoma cruzi]|uniref:Putative serine/threonine protein kinase n=1 Tax=Trypanosoma cruzi TaxID=5693 RepID=A0A2V2WHM2_TRYCR|nr:putative serine/threonine protein kinase [Trypanosoma cruzi]
MLMDLGAGGTLGDFSSVTKRTLRRSTWCVGSGSCSGAWRACTGRVDSSRHQAIEHPCASACFLAWESDVEFFFVDFGIAALVADSSCETELTVIGSGVYCPPEIAKYWGYRKRCPYSYASDVWSTAAVFYCSSHAVLRVWTMAWPPSFSTDASPSADVQ